MDTGQSLILESRRINDESPAWVGGMAERMLGGLRGRSIALLGAAYRFNSDDARNSPTFPLAHALRSAGASVCIHDPYVRSHDAHVRSAGLTKLLTADLEQALDGAELAIVCVAHRDYVEGFDRIVRAGHGLRGVIDAANAYDRSVFEATRLSYEGVGRGRRRPPADLCRIVYDTFRVVERGVANEVAALINVLNARYAPHDFARVRFEHLQQVVGTCATGCAIADPGRATRALDHGDFSSRLVAHAVAASVRADQTRARRAPLPGSAARSRVRQADA